MDINNVLAYLREELKDIPAEPKNVHYTDFQGLYYILQGGLKGQKGGYVVHSPKTGEDDMELSTVRNTHKLSSKEKASLSSGAVGGVKIDLFTDRILAGHRGSRKDKIAELPEQRKRFMEDTKKDFKKEYGFEIPDLFNTYGGFNDDSHDEDLKLIRKWIKTVDEANKLDYGDRERAVVAIYFFNRDLFHYKNELTNREREERFILKKSIPAKPEFMHITLEVFPHNMSPFDKDFIEDVGKANYLKVLEKHTELFEKNDEYKDWINYLRYYNK